MIGVQVDTTREHQLEKVKESISPKLQRLQELASTDYLQSMTITDEFFIIFYAFI